MKIRLQTVFALFARSRRGLAPALLLLVLACSESWVLVRVIDGDTLRARKAGHEEKVRLKGVDAPEIPHPRFGRFTLDPYGYESKECLSRLVGGHTLRLEFDTPRGLPERDQYGRLLAYVWADGVLVNAELIRRGCARAYLRFPHSRLEEFIRLEAEARAAERGLWGLEPG